MSPLILHVAIASGVIALIALAGFLLHRRHQRTWTPRVSRLDPRELEEPPHPLAIVVFTSRFCMACRETLRLAATTAPEVPVVQVPLHEHPEAARRYGLVETPTLMLVDERRRIRYCAIGTVDEKELWLYVREAWDSSTMVRGLAARRRAL